LELQAVGCGLVIGQVLVDDVRQVIEDRVDTEFL
jgi:hypothetical protein